MLTGLADSGPSLAGVDRSWSQVGQTLASFGRTRPKCCLSRIPQATQCADPGAEAPGLERVRVEAARVVEPQSRVDELLDDLAALCMVGALSRGLLRGALRQPERGRRLMRCLAEISCPTVLWRHRTANTNARGVDAPSHTHTHTHVLLPSLSSATHPLDCVLDLPRARPKNGPGPTPAAPQKSRKAKLPDFKASNVLAISKSSAFCIAGGGASSVSCAKYTRS